MPAGYAESRGVTKGVQQAQTVLHSKMRSPRPCPVCCRDRCTCRVVTLPFPVVPTSVNVVACDDTAQTITVTWKRSYTCDSPSLMSETRATSRKLHRTSEAPQQRTQARRETQLQDPNIGSCINKRVGVTCPRSLQPNPSFAFAMRAASATLLFFHVDLPSNTANTAHSSNKGAVGDLRNKQRHVCGE